MLEKDLFDQFYETKDVALRNKLVEKHLYMVDILIRKYLGKGIEYDDLYQVGAMALISAVDRFNPHKGFEFSSFATPTILGEIRKYFRDKGWSVKVPRRMKELSSSINRVKEEMTNKLGRVPTVKELAEELNETEENVMHALETGMAYGALSINQTFDQDGEENGNAVFEKYISQEEKGYEAVETIDIIRKVLSKLTGTNRYIFKKRFIEDVSQSEIARELGVSQMTISRAEKKMIEKFAAERAR